MMSCEKGKFPYTFGIPLRLSAHSFTLRGHKFFKKGQLQGCLKQLSLEQDPGHNTR